MLNNSVYICCNLGVIFNSSIDQTSNKLTTQYSASDTTMPPKRKAHPDAASNVVKQPHKPKTPKMSAKDSATKTTSVKYKYCNASTVNLILGSS